MDTFSKRFKILKEYRDKNGIYVKDEEFTQIDRLYQKIMGEKRHANLSEQEKESMLTGVARDILVGMTERKTFLRLSDHAHMQYYDSLMNEQSEAITDALKRHGLTPDVLKNKGITHKNDVISPQDENGIAINTEKGVDDEGYPCIKNMQIYLYGELIYDYRDGMEQPIRDYDIRDDDYKYEYEKEQERISQVDLDNAYYEELYKYKTTKSGKPTKLDVFKLEVSDGETFTYSYYEDKNNNLRLIRRNAKTGRFA